MHSSRWIVGTGIVAWLLATALTWPSALSFGDEVGYVSQARAVLDGTLRPTQDDVAVLVHSPHGEVPKYPPAFPVALAPLVALSPKLVFLLPVLALAALTLGVARILEGLGHEASWALLFLAHPTFVLVGRTAMTDVPLAALTVATWWTMRRGRLAGMAAFAALLVLCKPPGVLLGVLLGVGEIVRRRLYEGSGWRAIAVTLLPAVAGGAAGLAGALLLNLSATGELWYAYGDAHADRQVWSVAHLRTVGVRHLVTLVLLPPGLVLGAYPLWRRREFGPLLVGVGYVAWMSFYFFVDTGASLLDTLVLSPRLILPAVAMLLVGYAFGLDSVARRWQAGRALRWVLLVVVPIVAIGVGRAHAGWHGPMAAAREAAEEVGRSRGARALGVWRTPKEALLSELPVKMVDADASTSDGWPRVILCTARYRSRRYHEEPKRPCRLPGYDRAHRVDGYVVLHRSAGAAP
ncbi:MAG: hypothetical protein ACOC9T_02815 [Myxococcota bacterium]